MSGRWAGGGPGIQLSGMCAVGCIGREQQEEREEEHEEEQEDEEDLNEQEEQQEEHENEDERRSGEGEVVTTPT